jgi:hypothetical protein
MDFHPSISNQRRGYATGCNFMLASRITRTVRRHYRAALVWAAIPLAVFNGRTVVGCGCFGYFESVCHCGCCGGQHGKAICSCCTSHGFSHSRCSGCNQSESTSRCDTTDGNTHSAGCKALAGHRCTSFVKHEVTPVTVAPHVIAGDLHDAIFALVDVGQTLVLSQTQIVQVVDFDTGPPPNDLVVTLHRLVI